MLVNADIYVKDIPGQLVVALEPMSMVNANIIGVVHSREQVISGRIAVNITFDIESNMIDKLKTIWESRDVLVAKIGSVIKTYSRVYMLIGSVTAPVLEKLLDNAKKEIEITSVDFRLSYNSNGKNTAMIQAGVGSEDDLSKLDVLLANECSKNKFTFIRGVDL